MSSWVVLYCLFIKSFNGWNGPSLMFVLFSSQFVIVGLGLRQGVC